MEAASLDVINPEPSPEDYWAYSHPRVRLTPHISSRAPVTEERIDQILFDNIATYRAGAIHAMHGLIVAGSNY